MLCSLPTHTPKPPHPDSMGSFLPLVLMFAVLYFLMIRPQQKKQKEQREMINALTVGDEVLTSGGIVGKITKVSDNFLTLQIAEGTEILIQSIHCFHASERHYRNAVTDPGYCDWIA